MRAVLRAGRIGLVLLRYRLDDLLDDTPAERWLKLGRPFVPRASAEIAAQPDGLGYGVVGIDVPGTGFPRQLAGHVGGGALEDVFDGTELSDEFTGGFLADAWHAGNVV